MIEGLLIRGCRGGVLHQNVLVAVHRQKRGSSSHTSLGWLSTGAITAQMISSRPWSGFRRRRRCGDPIPSTTRGHQHQKRSLSSSSGGDKASDFDRRGGGETSAPITRKDAPPRSKGPILMRNTPRSVAAAKLRSNEGQYPPGSKHPQHHNIYGDTPFDPTPTPYKLASYGEESLYTLVLLRHGESEWNRLNRYTGWCDVDLTTKGEAEARSAGRLLYENGIEIDHAFTSVLKRASFSCNMALNMAKHHWVPVTKTWRLNERHYGALQGYNKDTAYDELGLDQELVMQMRRAYDVRPPRMEDDHPYWHGKDRRYRKLTAEQLDRSRAESLKDAAERIMPFWKSVIVPSIRAGNRCLIVSHANTIRTLIKHIDQISDEDIKSMTIPTGIPLLYRLDKNLRPVDPQVEMEFRYMVEPKGYTWGTSRAHGFHGVYLGDLERLQDIQVKRDKTNRDWQRIILRNVGKSLGWDMDVEDDGMGPTGSDGPLVLETRQLWWHIHNKMQNPEYGNMLLLAKMEDWLEDMMFQRGQKYITKSAYEKMINKVHLDAEGQVVEPFVKLAERQDREARQQIFYDQIALDLEEECLIK